MTKMSLLALLLSLASAPVFADAPELAKAMMEACKKECPKAKSTGEVFACTEVLEHGKNSKAFLKSKCYEAHHDYEKALADEAAK